MANFGTVSERLIFVIGFVFVVAAVCSTPNAVRAETGSTPTSVVGTTQTGVNLTIDPAWVDSVGYRPVRITITPSPGPAPKVDRRFRIELLPNSWYGSNRGKLTVAHLDFPAGSTVVTQTILVPQAEEWNQVAVNVFENDRLLGDLSSYVSIGNRPFSRQGEIETHFLVIDSRAPVRIERFAGPPSKANAVDKWQPPDLRVLEAAFTVINDQTANVNSNHVNRSLAVSITEADRRTFAYASHAIALMPFADLPERWLELSGFDVAVLSFADLKKLVSDETVRWSALRAWTAAGGTLIVYGVNDKAGVTLNALDELLRDEAAEAKSSTSHRWVPANVDLWSEDRTNLPHSLRIGNDPRFANQARGQNGNEYKDKPELPPERQPAEFHHRHLGLGNVVALREEAPFDRGTRYWNWIARSLSGNPFQWSHRTGISTNHENHDFWTFLVPGIGRAPIGGYLTLITVFVIVIGPVNYLALRHLGRLSWLIVTVPLGAGLVTVSLLAYALISDGLGTRARVRSVMWLDGNTGNYSAWSRHSYYAGLAPSQGLSFSKDTAVYPIEATPFMSHDNRSHRVLEWNDRQQLKSGYITSRNSVQFLVVDSGATTMKLFVRETNQPSGASVKPVKRCQIKNDLQTRIQWLLVANEDGQLYAAENIPAEKNTLIEPTTVAAAALKLRRLITENAAELPPGFDPQVLNAMASSRSRRTWIPHDNSLVIPSFSNSVLDGKLRELEVCNGALRSRSFVAFVPTNPAVPLGVKATEQASLHVIVGTW